MFVSLSLRSINFHRLSPAFLAIVVARGTFRGQADLSEDTCGCAKYRLMTIDKSIPTYCEI